MPHNVENSMMHNEHRVLEKEIRNDSSVCHKTLQRRRKPAQQTSKTQKVNLTQNSVLERKSQNY